MLDDRWREGNLCSYTYVYVYIPLCISIIAMDIYNIYNRKSVFSSACILLCEHAIHNATQDVGRRALSL